MLLENSRRGCLLLEEAVYLRKRTKDSGILLTSDSVGSEGI